MARADLEHRDGPWSEREDTVLKQTYRSGGVRGVQRALRRHGIHREATSVAFRASRIGLKHDPTKKGKLVPLVDVHPMTRANGRSAAHPDIIAAAEADGVLTRAKAYPHQYLAPFEWVERYAEQLAKLEAWSARVKRSWVGSEAAARMLHVRPSTLTTLASRGGNPSLLQSLLADVDTVVLRVEWAPGRYTHRRFWNPNQLAVAAHRYRARRSRSEWHKARGRDGGG